MERELPISGRLLVVRVVVVYRRGRKPKPNPRGAPRRDSSRRSSPTAPTYSAIVVFVTLRLYSRRFN
uniref:Uncharacterized protein n=1 Tax=Hyaloperonospora arabidopsidis (strain Emoy2) TaxID=559515 RepID=M4BUK6_HYAAE